MPVVDPRGEGLSVPAPALLALAAVFALPPGGILYLLGFFFAYFMNDQVDLRSHAVFLGAGSVALCVSAAVFSALVVRHLRPAVPHPVLAGLAATAAIHAAFLAVFGFFMARTESGSAVVAAMLAITLAAGAAMLGMVALRLLRPV